MSKLSLFALSVQLSLLHVSVTSHRPLLCGVVRVKIRGELKSLDLKISNKRLEQLVLLVRSIPLPQTRPVDESTLTDVSHSWPVRS